MPPARSLKIKASAGKERNCAQATRGLVHHADEAHESREGRGAHEGDAADEGGQEGEGHEEVERPAQRRLTWLAPRPPRLWRG